MPTFRPRNTRQAQRLRSTPTEAEKLLWRHLSNRQLGGHKFSRQMPIGPFVVDFVCRQSRLIVEVDGGQHTPARDASRTAYLEAEDYRVIRFWNNEVFQNVEGVLLTIIEALKSCPPPAPPASGRGED